MTNSWQEYKCGYRPEWWPRRELCGGYGILEICERLHTDHTGASDPLDRHEFDLMRQGLNWALANWREPSSDYDLAVRSLAIATLTETSKTGAGESVRKRADPHAS